jgi:hypothetical protein
VLGPQSGSGLDHESNPFANWLGAGIASKTTGTGRASDACSPGIQTQSVPETPPASALPKPTEPQAPQSLSFAVGLFNGGANLRRGYKHGSETRVEDLAHPYQQPKENPIGDPGQCFASQKMFALLWRQSPAVTVVLW